MPSAATSAYSSDQLHHASNCNGKIHPHCCALSACSKWWWTRGALSDTVNILRVGIPGCRWVPFWLTGGAFQHQERACTVSWWATYIRPFVSILVWFWFVYCIPLVCVLYPTGLCNALLVCVLWHWFVYCLAGLRIASTHYVLYIIYGLLRSMCYILYIMYYAVCITYCVICIM